MIVVQPQQEELFLEHPVFDAQGRLPFQYKTLYKYQQEDPCILVFPTNQPHQYQLENMGGYGLVCHYQGQHNRICLTDTLLPMVVDWFHKAMAHNTGITCLQETLHFHFYHPRLLAEVRRQVSRCDICQCMKCRSRQYGLLVPREAKSAPWSDVTTDCIGPWVIELHGGRDYSLHALTTIDIMTNLLEIEPIVTQTTAECARAFENGWLSCYLCPVYVIHDQGSEFMGLAFQDLLCQAGIKLVPTTACNPKVTASLKLFINRWGKSCTHWSISIDCKPCTKQNPWVTPPWPWPCMPHGVLLTRRSIISLLVPLPFTAICFSICPS